MVFDEFLNMKRQSKLKTAAEQLGLEFSQNDVLRIESKCVGSFILYNASFSPYNVISGQHNGFNIYLFDTRFPSRMKELVDIGTYGIYSLIFGTSSNPTSVCLIELDSGFPHLLVNAENIGDKVLQGLGFQDINFDNITFSQRYRVKGDQQFAYGFFTPRMIESYMDQDSYFRKKLKEEPTTRGRSKKNIPLEVRDTILVRRFPYLIPPGMVKDALDLVTTTYDCMEPYLFEDYPKKEGVGPFLLLEKKVQNRSAGEFRQSNSLEINCPWCGTGMEYIEDYQDHYCWDCERYLGS